MIRNWYMCVSEASLERAHHGWRELIIAAVKSATEHTHLRAHLIYDGTANAFTKNLEELNVRIHHHRVSFYDALVERAAGSEEYLSIGSGAFLRVEIPLIEKEDEFVLYTDCDIMFLRAPGILDCRPSFFACATQFSKTDYENDMNTGVMVMNVAALRDDLPAFTSFIKANLSSGWPGFDQEHYRRFYRGRWGRLPIEANWKPYWGTNPEAEILHWHGPKPAAVSRKLKDTSFGMPASWEQLFQEQSNSYRWYMQQWDKFADGKNSLVPPSILGHIDLVENKTVHGWAINRDAPETVETLSAYANGILLATIPCSSFRADLKRIYGTDVGAFRWQMPRLDEEVVELTFVDRCGEQVELGYKGRARKTLTFVGGRLTSAEAEIPNVPTYPMMPPASAAHLVEALKETQCYLEFGAGGSTVKAIELGVPLILTVESDPTWLDRVRRASSRFGSRTEIAWLHADIGATRELGYPKDESEWKKFKDYALMPWSHLSSSKISPDLVLIDGRFRLACALTTLLFGRPGCRLLIDDYLDRPYYSIIEKFVVRLRTIDALCEFVVPKELPRDQVWLALFDAVSDPR